MHSIKSKFKNPLGNFKLKPVSAYFGKFRALINILFTSYIMKSFVI